MEIIEEIIKNCQKYLLFEKAIAKTIKTIANEVINDIYFQLKNISDIKILNNAEYKTNTLKTTYKNYTLNIKWEYFNFKNKNTFNENIKNVLNNHKSFHENNNINLVFIALNNVIKTKKIENKVYHELTHWFQEYIKGGKKAYKPNINLYNRAIRQCYNSNELIATASKIIWLYHKFEQDAECHGLYGILMTASSLEDMKNKYIKSEQYFDLNDIKTFVNDIENDYFSLNDKEKQYADLDFITYLNVSLKSILTKAKKLIKRLERNYGRVWLQAQYDFREKNNIKENIDPEWNMLNKNKNYKLETHIKQNDLPTIDDIRENFRGFSLPLIIF